MARGPTANVPQIRGSFTPRVRYPLFFSPHNETPMMASRQNEEMKVGKVMTGPNLMRRIRWLGNDGCGWSGQLPLIHSHILLRPLPALRVPGCKCLHLRLHRWMQKYDVGISLMSFDIALKVGE